MTLTVNIHQAKTQLSKLIAAVEKGESVTIANNGVPKVKLVLIDPKPAKRVLGQNSKPDFWISDDFDAPMKGWWDDSEK
jgi:prevent-host-death family protein